MNHEELTAIRKCWDDYVQSQSEQHGNLTLFPVAVSLLDIKLTKVFAEVVNLQSDLEAALRERNSPGAEVPDVNEMDRGFGNCPHCRSPRVTRCHECLNEIFRDEAHAAGWRMDHLSGFGCIALCPDHK